MLIPEEKRTVEEEDPRRHTPPPSGSPPSYDQVSPPPPIAGPSTSTTTYGTWTAAGSQPIFQYQSPSEAILSHLLSTFVTAATNYVYVSDANNSVKGSWTIDTDLSPPPALLAPVAESERKNLYVHSKNGSLNAKIRLISPPRALYERATFHCSSQNGSVQVYVLPRSDQPFYLNAHSANGYVRVYLPRDFNGPIEHNTLNGTTTFSPEVRPHVTTFSSNKGEGKGFLGDWQSPQFAGIGSSTSDWPGDRLVVSSKNGNIYIQYVDEEKLEPAYLKTIKGWFNSSAEAKQLLGEANRIVKDKIGGRRQF